MRKVKKYIKQGYSNYKAEEMVYEELEGVFSAEAEKQRILRGVALNSGAQSYLDRVQ